MDFDEMLETWRSQNTAPPQEVNRDTLRQALQAEVARVLKEQRLHRRGLWFLWIFGGAMAVWAAFWIAITITNGWPVIYVITSAMSIALFATAVGASWMSRSRDTKRNFGNTLEEEVRSNLALVSDQLLTTRRILLVMLATACTVGGAFLFSWTVNRSQDVPDDSGGWVLGLFALFCLWGCYKAYEEMRKAKPKLELRQQRLRELLASLGASE